MIEARLAKFSSSIPLTEDPAVIEPLSIVAKMLVHAIRAIEKTVEQLQDKIAALFAQHPDHFLFENLPGAGKNLAPRLLCVFGSGSIPLARRRSDSKVQRNRSCH